MPEGEEQAHEKTEESEEGQTGEKEGKSNDSPSEAKVWKKLLDK